MRTVKRNARLIEAFGQEKTIREWSEDLRCLVELDTLRSRLSFPGWTAEEAISKPKIVPECHEAFGESKSYAEWVRDARCVVDLRSLLGRLERGWTLERALTEPLSRKSKPLSKRSPTKKLPGGAEVAIAAFGEMKSLREWAADPRCAVRYIVLRDRLRGGWSVEDAIQVRPGGGAPPVIPDSSEPSVIREPLHFVKSTDYFRAFDVVKSLASWAADPRCVVSERTLCHRLRMGVPFETALTSKRLNPGPGPTATYEAFGEFRTVREWSEDPRCLVTFEILRSRVRRGIPADEAMTRSPIEDSQQIESFGESKVLYQWAQDPRCQVGFQVLYQRVARGWPIEEAITAPAGTRQPRMSGPDLPTGTMKQNRTRQRRWWDQAAKYDAFGEAKTLTDWSLDSRCVVGFNTLYHRVKSGVPLEHALTLEKLPRRVPKPMGRKYDAFGEKKTLREWAADPRCRVSLITLRARIDRHKWPVERAISEAPG